MYSYLFQQMVVPELSDEAFGSEFTYEELDSSNGQETQTVAFEL